MDKPGYLTQDQTPDIHTKVNAGYSKDQQVRTSEFILAYRDGSGQHEHIAIDQYGRVVHDTTGSL